MAADVGVMSKPRFIVLGGCGFIGRNFVQYLIENDIASEIRVVDKVPPQTAWLNPKHQKTFEDPRIVFRSANLINTGSCEAAFAPNGDNPFDYAVNCACETKPGQTDPVYKEGILKLSMNCANEAAKQGVKRFIELSDGHMCSSDKAPFKEDGKPEPWTYVAKWKCQVEEELKNVPDLKYTVVRPGIVYGLGDRHGLAPRLVIGAVYRHLGEMMKLLWGRDLRMNTVHVEDVCRAIWHLAQRDDTVGQVYHVVDAGDTTQGDISSIVSDLFDINHDYWGNTLSSICKADMASVVEEVNDKHMGPWAEACARDGVENTPLTPYIDQELLYNKHLYLDNSKLLATGFELSVPRLSKDKLKESPNGEVGRAVDVALEAGYRHIDTAYAYGNEAEIGQTLKKWFDSGRLKREDVFIVTKLPFNGNRAESVEKYLKKSLEALQLEYVDLYLIHHPVGHLDVDGSVFPRDKDGKLLLDMNTDHISLWKAMEAQVDAGRARSIGLSNFNARQVKRIWQAARIPPANLQVELHVYFRQRELAAFCRALDVTVCAYAPIGSPGMIDFVRKRGGDTSKIVQLSPMTDPVVVKIAQQHGKTPAQVLLRHLMQHEIVVIPKSVNPERIKQNFDVFDFELTPDEMDQLDALDKGPKGRMFGAAIGPDRARHPEYPFKERY